MPDRPTVGSWLNHAAGQLTDAHVPDARLEARWMLADAMGISSAGLTIRFDETVSEKALALAERWLQERMTGRPLQYVQGHAWFMGHEFRSDERALIPRQDTEILCEQAILRVGHGKKAVLDLCTGSGAIAVSIKLACPDAEVWACDLSEEALSLAKENALRLGAQITFAQGDFLQAVQGRQFDVIACNPPYLTADDMRKLQREVTCEPRMALYGGNDGLDFYRRAAKDAAGFIKSGGWLLMEIGQGQGEDVCSLLDGAKLYNDLSGIPRVAEKRF